MVVRDIPRSELRARFEAIFPMAQAAARVLMARRGQVARPDGQIALAGGAVTELDWKGARDLVSLADREAEAVIVEAIAEAFPGDALLAEEGTGGGRAHEKTASGFLWVIDPLDGTTNFVHGLPHFAVSIACAWEGVVFAAGVYAPALWPLEVGEGPGIFWSAFRGEGAWRQGQAIRVQRQEALSKALVATGFPYHREDVPVLVGRVERALRSALGLRRLGSAALDLCQVADGSFGAFWEGDLKPWDLAAGQLIVTEAGGQVSDLQGGTLGGAGGLREILASNGTLHEAMLREVLA